MTSLNRRQLLKRTAAAAASLALPQHLARAAAPAFALKYLMGSAMYGELPLEVVIEETPKTGAAHLDVWPRKHGSQREQMDELGHDLVLSLLEKHQVKLAVSTRYDLGPFKLKEEFAVLKKFGGSIIVTGGKGKAGLKGEELKAAVKAFAEELKPHLHQAGEHGITIAIENHGKNLIESPDSIKWLAEFGGDLPLGIDLAPYHLPQDPELLAGLIRTLGSKLSILLAWQYGMGCMKPMPKEEELQQMPGRGKLDFKPLIQALKDINFQGFTEIFMHPTPRGIPILPTAQETTGEINRSRKYLEGLL